MTQADGMIYKKYLVYELRSTLENDKNKANSSACQTTNNDLLAFKLSEKA